MTRSRSCRRLIAAALCLAIPLAGCGLRHGGGAKPSAESAATDGGPAISAIELHDGRLALLTPTAVSGHEEDRQSVAVVFTDALARERPDLPVTTMAKTLSAINAAGLADAYVHMYGAYKDTGLFDAQLLRKIGQAVDARYLVQLKLAAFDESGSGGVFNFMGINVGREQTATARLFVQIWDSSNGGIVWERSNEASEKKHSLLRTRTIKMEDVVKSDVEAIIKQLPGG